MFAPDDRPALINGRPVPHDDGRAHLRQIVREKTDDGRDIIDFLLSAMRGEIRNAKFHHRFNAAKLLLDLGLHEAQDFIDAYGWIARGLSPCAPRANRSGADPALARIIRRETNNGADMIHFLVDVMKGKLPRFKPHHRLSSAKELLHRGFDTTPARPTTPRNGSPRIDEATTTSSASPSLSDVDTKDSDADTKNTVADTDTEDTSDSNPSLYDADTKNSMDQLPLRC